MKAYFFKTSREIATGEVRVQDVMETSRRVKPYYMRRGKIGIVETMQVFTRKKDALEACQICFHYFSRDIFKFNFPIRFNGKSIPNM